MREYIVIESNTLPSTVVGSCDFAVSVRNIYSVPITVALVCTVNGVWVDMYPGVAEITPSGLQEFTGSFIMPGSDATVWVGAYYWDTNDTWSLGDELTKAVGLGGSCSIEGISMTYDAILIGKKDIPIYDIPGKEGKISVLCRNNSGSRKTLSIDWAVLDPDAHVIEHYQDTESWPYTDTGQTHQFVGGTVHYVTPGTWSIGVILYADGVETDRKFMTLAYLVPDVPLITEFTIVSFTPATVSPGKILSVTVSFKYIAAKQSTVSLYAAIPIPLMADISGTKSVDLGPSTTPTLVQEIIDISISGGKNGTFDLYADITGTGASCRISNAITMEGATGLIPGIIDIGQLIGAIIPMIIMIVIVSLMMPLMSGLGEG